MKTKEEEFKEKMNDLIGRYRELQNLRSKSLDKEQKSTE
jgi:hypothetical protein